MISYQKGQKHINPRVGTGVVMADALVVLLIKLNFCAFNAFLAKQQHKVLNKGKITPATRNEL